MNNKKGRRLTGHRPLSCIYLDKIRMWLSRTNWILNHSLSRLRGCCHVWVTWGAIGGATPVTTGPRVCRVATSVPVGCVAIPRPLVRVTAARWIAMCRICWNESKGAWVDLCMGERMHMGENVPFTSNFLQNRRTHLVLSRWQYKQTPCGHVQLSPADWQNTKNVEEQ